MSERSERIIVAAMPAFIGAPCFDDWFGTGDGMAHL
jgi:hypothetical protein